MLSTIRRKVLSGWLKKNQPKEFRSKLKLQKFLFFYEALSKIEGDKYDFGSLKGYSNGPVFSDVYGDYKHRTDDFVTVVQEAYELFLDGMIKLKINEDRAKLVGFLVKILSEQELSDLSHEFNIWKCNEEDIKRGERHLSLNETDFNLADVRLMRQLRDMYNVEYIDSVEVHWFADTCFIISKEESQLMTPEHETALVNTVLENEGEIMSPAYLTLEDGVLVID